MDEEYRDIPGYEYYQASDQGNIRHWVDGEWVIPNRYMGNGQKHYEKIYIAGHNHSVQLVAHLIALAFIGERPSGAILRHLNDDGRDNRACNLCYGTYWDNAQDKIRNGHGNKGIPHSWRNGHAKLVESDVADIMRLSASGMRQIDIAAKYGMTQSAIGSIIRGSNWIHVPREIDIPKGKRNYVSARGNRNNAKIFTEDVLGIINDYKSGIPKKEIIDRYHVSKSLINSVLRGDHWIIRKLEEGITICK
jgi:hypothetical protein